MNATEENLAVIYARFSSNNQREESIDAQLRACKEFAQRNNYIVVSTYCDSAKSGTSAEREQFQKMISDSEDKGFRYIIVHKLDRFSRDKYDSVYYKRKLRNNDIRVISALENLKDDPESIMLESVLEGMSQYYSANLSREVMKGLKENAYKCMHTGGYAPLGYDVDKGTKKYKINVEEAEIVKIIFNMYTNHYGYSEIINYLNNFGYRTKSNNKFSKSSINSILRNEKYRGLYIYNRKKERDYTNKRKPTFKADDEVIQIENGMPTIIEDEVFYKAKSMLDNNRLKGGKHNAKRMYLLSGLIKCGICGSSYCGNSRTGGSNKSMYSSYRCSSKQSKKGCTCKEIRKEFVENFVLDELNDVLFNDNSIEQLTDMLNNHKQKQNKENEKKRDKYNKELESINNEVSNILKLVSNGSLNFDTVKHSIGELESRKKYIEQLLLEASRVDTSTYITNERVKELIQKSKVFLVTKNISECRKFINSYVDNVVVYNDKVEVNYKISIYDEALNEVKNLSSFIQLPVLHKKYKGIFSKSV